MAGNRAGLLAGKDLGILRAAGEKAVGLSEYMNVRKAGGMVHVLHRSRHRQVRILDRSRQGTGGITRKSRLSSFSQAGSIEQRHRQQQENTNKMFEHKTSFWFPLQRSGHQWELPNEMQRCASSLRPVNPSPKIQGFSWPRLQPLPSPPFPDGPSCAGGGAPPAPCNPIHATGNRAQGFHGS